MCRQVKQVCVNRMTRSRVGSSAPAAGSLTAGSNAAIAVTRGSAAGMYRGDSNRSRCRACSCDWDSRIASRLTAILWIDTACR